MLKMRSIEPLCTQYCRRPRRTTTGQASYEFLFVYESARTTAPSTGRELPSFLVSRVQQGADAKSATDSRIVFEKAFVVVCQYDRNARAACCKQQGSIFRDSESII